ncbi:efflux RND transporter periplasmic adaptor subunit [Mangrovibacterium lignilyticum]|uniref:efflux RND transporter periplasmic adaptor subunit n=1 Tax=Mangrovibacterium lignilyticum TaxID=2668052 RepID=UPI0013D2ECD1|nr:efflux RND transporter periplasmic adaptor subunit [Mangrovibacterium lignilyticum]
MKNIIKKTLYTLATVLVCVLIFFQLQSNKAETAKITEFATQTGNFYPVKAMIVKAGTLETDMETTGFIQSETDLDVLAETQGTIKEVYKEKGDYVIKGDIIAKVDDELLAAQLSASKATYEQLKKEVDRFTKLHKQNAVTSQNLEEVKLNFESAEANYISAKRQFDDTRIKAPVSGFIENDFIEEGQYISRNGKVCNIIDSKKLKLKVSVAERDYQHIKIGQKVRISTPVYSDTEFDGSIAYIGKKAGFGNTFDADIKVIGDQQNLLKAGMFVTANIALENDSQGIYVPRKAINGSLKDASVYIIENGVAVSRNVKIGGGVDNLVEVTDGLVPGETLVTEGNYSIFNGAKVKILD